MKIKWCKCKEQMTEDYGKIIEFCYNSFIPEGWELEYNRIDEYEEMRYFYIYGKCKICRGYMRSGTSVPYNMKNVELIQYIWKRFLKYKPYDTYLKEHGCFTGRVAERSAFYNKIEEMPFQDIKHLFVSMFKPCDQKQIRAWIELYGLDDRRNNIDG